MKKPSESIFFDFLEFLFANSRSQIFVCLRSKAICSKNYSPNLEVMFRLECFFKFAAAFNGIHGPIQ